MRKGLAMCRYQPERIAAAIDLAVLQPYHTRENTVLACREVEKFNCASVCVKPCFVDAAAKALEGTGISVDTVLNFPHGNSPPDVVALEAYSAIGAGANELDMVMNIGAALAGEWGFVREGIDAVVAIGHEWNAIVKIILETCYLPDAAIHEACLHCVAAGADFVKTSTGFGPCGATERGVTIMRDTVAGRCQVKASGGIQTYADAEMYLDLGCTRLGASQIEPLFPY